MRRILIFLGMFVLLASLLFAWGKTMPSFELPWMNGPEPGSTYTNTDHEKSVLCFYLKNSYDIRVLNNFLPIWYALFYCFTNPKHQFQIGDLRH